MAVCIDVPRRDRLTGDIICRRRSSRTGGTCARAGNGSDGITYAAGTSCTACIWRCTCLADCNFAVLVYRACWQCNTREMVDSDAIPWTAGARRAGCSCNRVPRAGDTSGTGRVGRGARRTRAELAATDDIAILPGYTAGRCGRSSGGGTGTGNAARTARLPRSGLIRPILLISFPRTFTLLSDLQGTW